MTLVDTRHVTKRFGALAAADDVSLQVDRGEVVGLLGANGAGKTTLIRLILGLLAPNAGTVRLLGQPPSRRLRARVGYVPQGLGLWSDLSARDHLALSAAIYGATADLDKDIAKVADEPVGLLPLGLRRRLAFSLAVGHEPDVVILDEPTSGIDALGRARLWDRIRAVADDGAGVLVSTHYMDEAAQCDRVVLLAAGRVVAAGSVDTLTAGRSALAIRPADWERAWEALDAAGVPVLPQGRSLRVPDADAGRVDNVLATAGIDADLSRVPATLEEVFLVASSAG
jgi:ABC-2 type transport system ATP-binding protein/ribosome-dependent ATPase